MINSKTCRPQVWNVDGKDGKRVGMLVRTLTGHAHRINTMALNCEHALRTGPFGFKSPPFSSQEEGQKIVEYKANLLLYFEPILNAVQMFDMKTCIFCCPHAHQRRWKDT